MPDRPSAVLFDAGFTLTFPDTDRIAALAGPAGVVTRPEALDRAVLILRHELARGRYVWAATRAEESTLAPAGGAAFFRRMLELASTDGDIGGGAGAGPPPALLDAAARAIWAAHLERNVWCRVGPGVASALARLRAAGLKLAVVSNSEGTLETMLGEVGLGAYFETVIDSWVVGVAKPDPRIFALALGRLGGVPPAGAVMLGDTPSTDIAGAAAAGVPAVLVDPFDLHPAATVPRVPDVRAFVDALLGPS